MRAFLGTAIAVGILASSASQPIAQGGPFQISVTLPTSQATQPVDGRLLVMIAKDPKAGEPRFQINDSITGQLIFGVDVDGLKPGASVTVDGSALGFPLESINDIPGGTYSVQALIHKYETFKRSDGHTVKLPMDRGEGQQWARAPGNLYSTPVTVSFDPKKGGTIKLTLDKVIAPLPTPKDTEVRQARADPERAADEVLGPADASRRARAAAGRMGHASGREVSALHLSRPLPRRSHQLARDAARPQPRARTSRRASTGRATTARSRNTRGSSSRNGPARIFRAQS